MSSIGILNLDNIILILSLFNNIGARDDEVPLIIHHTLPFNLNSNAFISPYNKLAKWVAQLEAKGFFGSAPSDPHTPNYAIPAVLAPSTTPKKQAEMRHVHITPHNTEISCFKTPNIIYKYNLISSHLPICPLVLVQALHIPIIVLYNLLLV